VSIDGNYRAITTPFRLPYFRPIRSLRVLLTPTELRRPWILYKTPGLLLTHILSIAISIEMTLRIQSLRPIGESKSDLVWKIPLLVLVSIIFLVVLPALDVIKTKLSVQRNGPVEGDGKESEWGIRAYSQYDDVVA
jgi:hypothetical protein